MALDLDLAVIVALGGNLPGRYGSSAEVLRAALAALEWSGLKPVSTSSLWRSSAWPDPSDPDYLNAVAIVETSLPPAEVLALLHRIEQGFGARSAERNGPRVLDLDLIAYGRLVHHGELMLPHPRAAERLFVMGPLAEIAPAWVHPERLASASLLAEGAAVGLDARPT